MTPKEFVTKYYPYAKVTENKTGIPAMVVLAQSALETGWGKYAPGNMMFGVKAKITTPEKERQLITTTEILSTPNAQFPIVLSISKLSSGKYKYIVKDWFRKYNTPEESFTDHAKFLQENSRYKKALVNKSDSVVFIQELAKAGYATDPNYGSTLLSVLKTVQKLQKNG